jgi:hypothetical protein
MQTSNDPGIQQMCAVLTRKKIVGHWGELSNAVKEGIQQLIFDILMKDQARYISELRPALLHFSVFNNIYSFLSYL